jgi:hypothetical protein
MRKILLASNVNEVKTSAVDFACYIANLTRSPLTGILLENKSKKELSEKLVSAGDREYETVLPANIAINANAFCDRCLHNNARHSVHHVYGNPLHEMIKESLYADLILADGNTSFNEYDGWPSQFVKELLENAKCPVMITPFDFDEIEELVFAYDGSDSSIFAMKQFIYLFPEFNDVKITLLQVLNNDDDDITEKEKLKDFLMIYYDAVHYKILKGNAEMELFEKFLAQKNKMLVMGAYGRKKLFSRSTADILLKTLNIPIFITHH